MESKRERVISIALTEQDWQEFVRMHPQPVDWLRERIQESISIDSIVDPPAAAGEASTRSATRH